MNCDNMKKIFLTNLKRIHRESGIKQTFIAEKLGVKKMTVSHWIAGKYIPTFDNIEKLAEIYKIDWRDFFEEKRRKKSEET